MIILTNKENVAIVVENNLDVATVTALVNGKLYNVYDYRPINGDGRMLKEYNQAIINELLPIADNELKRLQEEQRIECAEREELEKRAEGQRVSFADALQDAFLNTLTAQASDELLDKVMPIASERIERELVDKFGCKPVLHEIRINENPAVEIDGVLHKQFDIILNLINDNEPIYLCGPAGTGKSFLAQQVAKALNLEFWYTNNVTDEIQLKGFIDANGNYHATQFYKAFTEGGIFLLDELDASVPETLVMLNNALANGYFDFPTGRKTAHENFRCMSAGNTCGTGADNVYTGRYQLDGSSLDRFAMIFVNYDRDIETALSGNDTELVDFIHAFRNATEQCGVPCLATYRAIKRLAKMVKYASKEDALKIALLKGLTSDEIRTIYNALDNMPIGNNNWKMAVRGCY